MNIKERFGAEVKAARLEEGITQKELSNRAGLKVPAISRIEHGRHNVSLEQQERIAKALNRVINNQILVKP